MLAVCLGRLRYTKADTNGTLHVGGRPEACIALIDKVLADGGRPGNRSFRHSDLVAYGAGLRLLEGHAAQIAPYLQTVQDTDHRAIRCIAPAPSSCFHWRAHSPI